MEARGALKEIFEAVPHIMKLNEKHIWFDYDDEVDVLYVSLEKPQQATDSELTKENIILRYKGKNLVGVTILNARNKLKKHKL
jgi:uncharacterized protein YuzE